MNIFDAIAYSISEVSQAESNTHKEPTKPHSSDSPPVDLEDAILDHESNDGSLFQDNPDEDKKENGYAGASRITDDLSTTFLELDEASDDSSNNPYRTSVQEVELVESNEEDESWTNEILEDDKSKIEPHISNSAASNELRATRSGNNETETSNATIAPDETKSTIDAKNNYESLNFYYQQDSQSLGRHWLISSLLFISIITLIITLLAQASWLHYEKLAKYPQAAALYEKACQLLKCQLPELSDIKRIKSNNLIVRSHPTTPKALIIDAIIVNTASFDQGFPDIALYFSDINNQIIAQRLIHPNIYLSGEILNWKSMPSNQPIHISLEIIDPGKEAVNYTLKFFAIQPE